MQEYVVGAAFDSNKENLVLIEKQKPEWQKDKYNLVGGKLESSENMFLGMRREFKEETGVTIHNWFYVGKLYSDNFILHCFATFTDEILNCKTMEQEKIFIVNSNQLHLYYDKLIPNLQWIIPFAKQINHHFPFHIKDLTG